MHETTLHLLTFARFGKKEKHGRMGSAKQFVDINNEYNIIYTL